MVHVKKVEIFGFKSFGFKNTIVDFEPGLVSISGPNGSGKSNILDAITFALGENRPKVMRAPNLRGLMHDVEGAARRGPKMARTSVHFDNLDRKIPVDSDIVTITREMNDKGDNIYYLNKKKVIRSKILDLMEIANAGLNQINNVQQGTVTRISEMTSEEKRIVIEDLIGLSAFDEKKKEAEKQLTDADHKLEIAMAKMGEVKKRIDELEEERNKKLRYDILERELNRYRAISAASSLKSIQSEKVSKDKTLNSLNSEIKHLEEERASIRKDASEIRAQKTKFMDEVNAYNKSKSEIETKLSMHRQKFDEADSLIKTSTNRLTEIDTNLPSHKIDLENLQIQKSFSESQISYFKSEINNIRETEKSFDEKTKNLRIQKTEAMRKQSQVITQKRDVDQKIQRLTDKITATKLAVGEFESASTNGKEKLSSNQEKFNSLVNSLDTLEKQKIKLERIIENHTHSISEINLRIKKFTDDKKRSENDIHELSELIDASSKGANKYETKIKFAKGIMHEDYSISKLKHSTQDLGIEGLVYEILSWDKKYERASLAVCSNWIKAVVVKDFESLISLAEFVTDKKLPKLKIIPLESIPQVKIECPKQTGVLGILSDYVKCENKFSSLKNFLFGNVVLVESRNIAINLSKSGFKTITLSGEYFEAKTTSVVIDNNSKISKLTKIINMSDSVEGLQQMISALRLTVTKKKNRAKKLDLLVNNYEKRLSLSEVGMNTTSNSLSELKSRISQISNNKKSFETRINQLTRTQERISRELTNRKSHLESLESQIKLVRDNYAEPQMDRIANEIKLVNEQILEQDKKLEPIQNDLKKKERHLAELMAHDTKITGERKNLRHTVSSMDQEKYHLEVDIRRLTKEKETTETELVTLRDDEQKLISTSGTSVEQMTEFDNSLESLNSKERDSTKEITLRERNTDALNRDLTDLRQKESKITSLLATFGFDNTIEVFDVDSPITSLESEQNRIQNCLNACAPLQYVEISNGYKSSSSKKNMLEKERNTIVAFIESVEKDKRQTFLDAFDTVDTQVKDAFSKMTGGSAWLELENEDDIFNSGLNYLIQFPGKPKRESTSISGGEKTLAATVFVLALQKLNPSPFYMFDEVDAHLDAPNAEKLSNIIKERSEGSQFIMVSLKDSVVEKARLIYGVFPKHGVSHVIKYKDKRLLSSLET
ncbi:MAG: chromosome segregation protein SMC [Candidatus Nitrosopelagicus brevis]|nr:chromosome segregation protein SMC [Candidatus Nitrosopelagicus brevis]